MVYEYVVYAFAKKCNLHYMLQNRGKLFLESLKFIYFHLRPNNCTEKNV